MRSTLMSWLPPDMRGMRLLDAGCGTGALAALAMQRGAEVVAIDLSPTLVQLARERYAQDAVQGPGSIQFLAGDMLSPATGEFDYVVGMDSLIHYDTQDIVKAVHGLSLRTRRAILFTFAPRTPLLAVMHSVGRLFPRSDRSPALEPVSALDLNQGLQAVLQGTAWQAGRSQRISSGFYTSQAWEWRQA